MDNTYQDLVRVKRDFGGCWGRPMGEKCERKLIIMFIWNLKILIFKRLHDIKVIYMINTPCKMIQDSWIVSIEFRWNFQSLNLIYKLNPWPVSLHSSLRRNLILKPVYKNRHNILLRTWIDANLVVLERRHVEI